MKDEVILVAFDSEHEALHFANLAKKNQIQGRLIPTPRRISAGCGMTWQAPQADAQAIKNLIADKGLQVKIYC